MSEATDGLSAIGIRQCALFLFQHQDVIANRNLVFAGLEDQWVRRHVTDSVGYFLGTLSLEILAKRERLDRLKTELATERRRLAEMRRLSSLGMDRGGALWSEAHALGMLVGEKPDSLTALRRALERVANWSLGEALPDIAHQLEDRLAQERESLKSLESLRRERDTAARYLRLSGESAAAATKGQGRISVRSLLPTPSDGDCPVCGGQLAADKWVKQLDLADAALSAEATIDPRVSSRLERMLSRVDREIEQHKTTLTAIRREIDTLRRTVKARQTNAELENQQMRLAGQAKEYLRAMQGALVSTDSDFGALQKEIDDLEAEVGASALRRLLDDVETSICHRATQFATDLKTEFGNAACRLRLRDVTIQVKVGGVWTHLGELGSGANWVSYHVACVLALHEAFQRAGRVPSVLLLDQPSQAWFPPDHENLRNTVEPGSDEDKVAVRRLYEVLHRFSEDTGIQLIVVDHAKPRTTWIDQRTAHDWHHGGALVPDAWLAQPRPVLDSQG